VPGVAANETRWNVYIWHGRQLIASHEDLFVASGASPVWVGDLLGLTPPVVIPPGADDRYLRKDIATGQTILGPIALAAGPWIDVTATPYGADPSGVADSTAAFAAVAAALPNGGIAYIPKGTFKGKLPMKKNGITWQGAGRYATTLSNPSGPVVEAGEVGVIHYAMAIRSMTIQNTSSGGGDHLFKTIGGIARCVFEDLNLVQANTNKRYYEQTGSGNNGLFIGNKVTNCEMQGVAGHAVTEWYHASDDSVVNHNMFENLWCTYSGAYVFQITCQSAGTWNFDNVFRNINFEVCNGGCIKGEGANNWLVEQCNVYDLSGATTQHLFYFGRYSTTGQVSRNISMRNCGRRGGTLGAGLADFAYQAVGGDTPGITIDSCRHSSGSAYKFDFGGRDATLIGEVADVVVVNPGRISGRYGYGIYQSETANSRMGRSTLVGGTKVFNTVEVSAVSEIFLTCQTPGGTPGFLTVSARTPGTSFTILSSSATDTSVVAWLIVEPF
jgi:hypothetical protein